MTRNEMRILSTTIKAILRRQKYVWLQLKREAWELGNQAAYPSQWDFVPAIQHAVAMLPSEQKALLTVEWGKAKPKRHPIEDQDFCAIYSACILEEVVARARVAAYRTINW